MGIGAMVVLSTTKYMVFTISVVVVLCLTKAEEFSPKGGCCFRGLERLVFLGVQERHLRAGWKGDARIACSTWLCGAVTDVPAGQRCEMFSRRAFNVNRAVKAMGNI